MSTNAKDAWRAFLLPKFRRVKWTWGRWFLLGLAILAFADEFLMPISHWNAGQSEGLLGLIIIFRAMAPAEPPPAVVAASTCLAALSAAMAHNVVREVSPVWTPVAFALLIFLLLTWRWGRKQPPADSMYRHDSGSLPGGHLLP